MVVKFLCVQRSELMDGKPLEKTKESFTPWVFHEVGMGAWRGAVCGGMHRKGSTWPGMERHGPESSK